MKKALLLLFLLLAVSGHAGTILVPSQQPTIQAGVDAAVTRDTILLADGTYTGDGNRDVTITDKRLVIRSEHGPTTTVIDCEGEGRAFDISGGESDGAVIEGLTIVNGEGSHQGGAIQTFECPITVRRCTIVDCKATYGGALYVNGAPATPYIENCTFVGNEAVQGSVYYQNYTEQTQVSQCIMYQNTCTTSGLPPVLGAVKPLTCCDLYVNVPGDWIGQLVIQGTSHGNFSGAPLFFDPSALDFRLQPLSPCLPANNDCATLVGSTCPPGEPDTDGDGICDCLDACPGFDDRINSDIDRWPDECDNCSVVQNDDQLDYDSDLRGDVCDNCVWVANSGQEDDDLDGVGNACTHDTFTPAGENVTVQLGPVELSFGYVGIGGDTRVTIVPWATAVGAKTVAPLHMPAEYRITSDAVYDGTVTVCVNYDDDGMALELEEHLTVVHYNGTDWQILGDVERDVVNNITCGTSASLGVFVVGVAGCCQGRTGDANGQLGDEPTIGDINALVDAIYISATCEGILACLAEADVNQSGGSSPTCEDITIGDINYLIGYLYVRDCYFPPCNDLELPDCLQYYGE